MRTGLWAFAALLLAACGDRTPPPPAVATDSTGAPVTKLVDRAWARAGGPYPPGSMQVFLSDGTLLSDSCFETYRLSRWREEGDGGIAWQEDGADIRARILSVDDTALVLELLLQSGTEQHRFVPATVPYVCPDLPR